VVDDAVGERKCAHARCLVCRWGGRCRSWLRTRLGQGLLDRGLDGPLSLRPSLGSRRARCSCSRCYQSVAVLR
jgi:hypothetical protein